MEHEAAVTLSSPAPETAGADRILPLMNDERVLRLARFTIDQAADAIYWAAEGGGIEYVNEAACRMLGYAAPELLKLNVWDLYSGMTSEVWRERWMKLKQDVLREEACLCRHRDGRLIPVEVTVKYLLAEGKQFTCAYVRDITARKLLEDQFRQAQKLEAVGRLAGGIAHDFNNLLTVINGYSALLLDRVPPGDPDRPALTEIHDAGTRAAALTRQLLAFSRKQRIQPVVLDLNVVMTGLEKLLARLLGEDIEVTVRMDRDLGRILADPGQIEQVLMNLCVNARDAMPGGGKLKLETIAVDLTSDRADAILDLPPSRYVMLTVSDTGCGMDETTQSHLFEPFFTTKELGKGTGLGLSTVYGIVTRAGGRISCQSAVGKGTTFVLTFPRCEDVGETAALPQLRPPERGSETLLLVEDDNTVRTLARVVLERYGYRVLEAAGAEEALQRAVDPPSPIDLLVSDMVMPGMSGIELIEEFAPRHPETDILIMSGYSQSTVTDAEINRRGLSYIEKPFSPEALAAKVRSILDRRAARPR